MRDTAATRWVLLLLVTASACLGLSSPAWADPPGAVSFTITDFRGDPAVGAELVGTTTPYGGGIGFDVKTDGAGHATANDVVPGSYYLHVDPERRTTDAVQYDDPSPVTVTSGATTDVAVQLPGTDWVTGRVTDQVTHKGLGGVQITAYSQCQYAGDLCSQAYGWTTPDGYYIVHSVGAQPYWGPTRWMVSVTSGLKDTASPYSYTIDAQPGLGHSGLDFREVYVPHKLR